MLSRSPSSRSSAPRATATRRSSRSIELQPDVVTCDLIMPNLDGVGFVREQMARQPVPIVIVSVASEAGELVLDALDAGAVDFVQKPTALASERLLEISEELIDKVKAAAARQRPRPRAARPARQRHRRAPLTSRGVFDIVVIGISTGGPQALKLVDPAAAGRPSRCRWRSCCTCRSASPSSTRASSTSCRRCTVVEAADGDEIASRASSCWHRRDAT